MKRARGRQSDLKIPPGSSAFAEGIKAAKKQIEGGGRKPRPGRPVTFHWLDRQMLGFIAVFLDADTKRGAQKRAFDAAAVKFDRSDVREIRAIWKRYAWMYHETNAAAAFLADTRNCGLLEALRKLK